MNFREPQVTFAWNIVVRSGINQASILKEIKKRLEAIYDQEVDLFI